MKHVVQAPVLLQARAAKRIAAALAGAAVLIFWLGRHTDIDLLLADAVYDAGTGQFPWRHAWLAETFNHVMVKQVLVLAGIGFVLAAALDAWRGRGGPGRDVLASLRLRIVALSAVLVPLVVSALKQASDSHCPWDLARYGGTQPYVRLLEALPAGAVAGHCLPAGHASGALWLVALAVFWLPARPRGAAAVAVGALLCGGVVGWLQQLRGAHFLTHTLWSIWIACALVLALVLALQAWHARRPARDGRESKLCN